MSVVFINDRVQVPPASDLPTSFHDALSPREVLDYRATTVRSPREQQSLPPNSARLASLNFSPRMPANFSPRMRTYRKEGRLQLATPRPSFREVPVGSIEARGSWFAASHPSWALAHTWEYEQERHALQRIELRQKTAERLRATEKAALHHNEWYAHRKRAAKLAAAQVAAASHAAAVDEIRFLPRLPAAAAIARNTWARDASIERVNGGYKTPREEEIDGVAALGLSEVLPDEDEFRRDVGPGKMQHLETSWQLKQKLTPRGKAISLPGASGRLSL